MSSFFTLPASQRKRKREDVVGAPASKKRGVTGKGNRSEEKENRKQERDESISGSESEDEEGLSGAESIEGSESESDEGETTAERRLRLAERYLENIQEEVDEVGFDAADLDRDLIADRLKEDVDESKGRTYRQIASKLAFAKASHSFFRADTQTTTSIAVHAPFAYTVSKDKTLIKWELATPDFSSHSFAAEKDTNGSSGKAKRPLRKKPKKLKSVRGLQRTGDGEEPLGHTGDILAVAASPSGQFVATAGADRRLIIWDAEKLVPLKAFTHHRDAVSGLSFTKRISSMSSGEQLFSSSFDRTIKTWSLSPGAHAYVETLFGHQDHVVSVASMATDQCVSVGARDRTARLWKVVDESQLVFRGGSSKGRSYVENTIDCVTVLPPAHFVTGSDNGTISLWSVHKKKPLFSIPLAHGVDPLPSAEDQSSEQDPVVAESNLRYTRPTARWITALATLPGTDILLSGSWDGWIRAWKISEDKRRIDPVGPIGGFDPSSVLANGTVELGASDGMEIEKEPPLKGIVNDIAVFERGGPDSKTTSLAANMGGKSAKLPTDSGTRALSIVVALGKEHRLGRWKVFGAKDHSINGGNGAGGRNGAMVFEVPFSALTIDSDVNGISENGAD
ncbi:hypothetical protein AJ80_05396 [Polytolypa hystricis UAMH7299]|uniref:Uncharacterized protein n=1 Tax=Polytolypa hystricis (strain UAMH7299) TaxID=1447883 RepID=A0A2B7Y3S7_POLH7|nr:hypothetical protein AJ80_05396 [Polytolypa hystricis UAMH7299]